MKTFRVLGFRPFPPLPPPELVTGDRDARETDQSARLVRCTVDPRETAGPRIVSRVRRGRLMVTTVILAGCAPSPAVLVGSTVVAWIGVLALLLLFLAEHRRRRSAEEERDIAQEDVACLRKDLKNAHDRERDARRLVIRGMMTDDPEVPIS